VGGPKYTDRDGFFIRGKKKKEKDLGGIKSLKRLVWKGSHRLPEEGSIG